MDDHLINEAVRLGHHRPKNDAVNAALDEYIRRRKQQRILSLFWTYDESAGPIARGAGRILAKSLPVCELAELVQEGRAGGAQFEELRISREDSGEEFIALRMPRSQRVFFAVLASFARNSL